MMWNSKPFGSHLTTVTLVLACGFSSGVRAHGPEGDHDHASEDAAADSAQAGAHAEPRMEARTELFELVATLDGGELSVMVDRYATNEPVLGGEVEVEAGGIKAKGTFHADHGDYAFTEPALLKALAQPGHHPVVFTVVSGDDSDLIEGALHVEPGQTETAHEASGHGVTGWKRYVLGALLALAVMAVAWKLLPRRARLSAPLVSVEKSEA